MDGMMQLAHDHFTNIFGQPQQSTTMFNWDELELDHADLHDMEDEFSLDEIKRAIDDMPSDKAPGPDGFSGGFFKTCWNIIKLDLHAALNQLHKMDSRGLARINKALIVLIPKKQGADALADFRPISLIHSIIKIFSKLLASRLAPKLNYLVDQCQSAFIKKRCIQENFLHVQNTARFFHKTKKPSILLKLDIAKAFDSVSWTYILDMLRARGFSARWREWIAMLLRTSSSRVLINGHMSELVYHQKGLRQGDPLFPFLFILAMDPLQRMMNMATSEGVLSKLPGRRAVLRCSFYADDVALFINPLSRDAQMIKLILTLFGQVTGLVTNLSESVALPIRCQGHDLQHIMRPLGIPLGTFPATYLGMPLLLRTLRKTDLYPLIDKFGGKTAAWKGGLMAKSGRLVLLKLALSTLATYMLSVHRLPVWVMKRLVKICRAWLWAGEQDCTVGKCHVSWALLSRPKELGGLGVLDLTKFGRALRLRWLWHAWTTPERPWVGSQLPCDEIDHELFAMATDIMIGCGNLARFWQDRWLNGLTPKKIAPRLFSIAARKNRTVREAMQEDRWFQDLANGLTEDMLPELIQLSSHLDSITLDADRTDEIR